MPFYLPVRPENIALLPSLLPSLQQGLREHTHVDVTCSVQQVKPRPRLFWRIGDTLPMHNGSRDDRVTEYSNGTFSVRSWYSFEARREDDGEFLYCIVVNERDSEEELGREKERLSVHCEYTPRPIFFGGFPIWGRRVKFSISTFSVLCFYLYLFLLHVFSYNITPPQVWSSYLSVSSHFHLRCSGVPS